MVFYRARFSAEIYEMCLRTVHLKDKREMILSTGSCSLIVKCDLMDMYLPTLLSCTCDWNSGTRMLHCQGSFLGPKQDTLRVTCVSLVGAYVQPDDAAKTGGREEAERM